MKRQVSIILISYNQLAYTKDCLQSIKKYTPKDQYEIIIVDNASDEETKSWLQEQSEIKVIFNEQNVGFPAACNQGIAIANPKNDILLLNNDTIVTSCWLENLSTCLHSQPIIGAAGAVCHGGLRQAHGPAGRPAGICQHQLAAGRWISHQNRNFRPFAD